jgi:hypothetical protein
MLDRLRFHAAKAQLGPIKLIDKDIDRPTSIFLSTAPYDAFPTCSLDAYNSSENLGRSGHHVVRWDFENI